MPDFKEKYRLVLSNEGKIRNRTEAHMLEYAQRLLAVPVALTIDQVWEKLSDELNAHVQRHPSHGSCRLAGPTVSSRIAGKPHLVTRSLALYGRGRGTYTLLIAETVRKDALNGYAPVAS